MMLLVSGASQTNPCVIATAEAHGVSNGDEVYIEGVIGMTELNGRYFVVGDTPTTTTFELMGVNATTYAAYGSGGTVQRVTGALTDWDYQYTLPRDCLRVLDISWDDGAHEWQVEAGQTLMCDAGPEIGIRYIQKITDTAIYEPLLVNALAARLAAELAQELTGNSAKKQAAIAEYMGFIEEAKAMDLREQTPVEIESDTWVSGRF